jgi:cystathionine gamma-lyase
MANETMAKETIAVHAGTRPDPSTGAIMTPIFASTTFVQRSPGEHQGYDYSRAGNPTRAALESALAALEGGKHGFAMASGCAATDTMLHLLDAGDEVVSIDDVYGGTSRLLRTVWARHGVTTRFVDLANVPIEEALTAKTKMVWIETPTNPMLKVVDIARVAEALRKRSPKPLLVVDNTFASPIFQNPLALGADVVLHSTTKYVNGHSDVIGGALVTNSDELAQRIHHLQKSCGAILGTFESWLTLRGLKTLALRMERHASNAERLAAWLEGHEKIERVLYPGLPSHPQHAIARKQMKRAGGMITIFLKSDLAGARRLLENVRLFALAESLGGVESLIEHPAIMTHASIPAETRRQLGISDTLIRLSVGVESADDLERDLSQALAKV